MTTFGRMIGELSAAWGGWQPDEIDIGGGWPSPRDPLNEEMARSEFLTTAAGYPLLVGMRGLGARGYHAAMSRILPAMTSHTLRPAPPSIEKYAAVAVGALRAELVAAGIRTQGVRLQVEPGRSLYGNAGIHLTRVKVVKHQTKPIPYTWVLTDTTSFFLAGGHFERSRFPHVVAGRADAEPMMTADLVGHSCFADQIVLGARFPQVGTGDVIALLETGAYQESSASNFNALPTGDRPGARLRRRGDPPRRGRRRRVRPGRRPRPARLRAAGSRGGRRVDCGRTAVTVDTVTWILATLQILTALGIVGYWQVWLRGDHDVTWWPTGYEEHERAFVLPDHVMAALLVISAGLSVSGSVMGAHLALVAAGMLLFLGLIDAAYFARNDMFARDRDGVGNALIVGWVLLLAVVLVVHYI